MTEAGLYERRMINGIKWTDSVTDFASAIDFVGITKNQLDRHLVPEKENWCIEYVFKGITLQ